MFKLVLEKAEEPRDQIDNIHWIIEKAREFQKNIDFCFIDYAKTFDCMDHNKLWKILKEMRIPDHLTGLLRNLYAGQEATVRTGYGTTDWFQIGTGVCQGCTANLGSNQPCLGEIGKHFIMIMGFPGGSAGKESACTVGDLGLIPRLGRSPVEGKGYPFQYSCLENPMVREAWGAVVHGFAESRT